MDVAVADLLRQYGFPPSSHRQQCVLEIELKSTVSSNQFQKILGTLKRHGGGAAETRAHTDDVALRESTAQCRKRLSLEGEKAWVVTKDVVWCGEVAGGIRGSVAVEETRPVRSKQELNKLKAALSGHRRSKERHSFVFPTCLYKIELTKVATHTSDKDLDAEEELVTYEIEAELLDPEHALLAEPLHHVLNAGVHLMRELLAHGHVVGV